MVVIDKDARLLFSVDFGKGTYENDILDTQPPLNALHRGP